MRKSVKTALSAIAVVIIIVAVFWGSTVYVSDYKIATVDTSISPDGTYELVYRLSERQIGHLVLLLGG